MKQLIINIGDAKGMMLDKLHHQRLKTDLVNGYLDNSQLVDSGKVTKLKPDDIYAIDCVTDDADDNLSYLYTSLLEHTEDLALLSEEFKYEPRMVEMYFGEPGNGGDYGTWFTDYVEIPLNTPDDKVKEIAINAAKEYANENNIQYIFIGVYNITNMEDILTC